MAFTQWIEQNLPPGRYVFSTRVSKGLYLALFPLDQSVTRPAYLLIQQGFNSAFIIPLISEFLCAFAATAMFPLGVCFKFSICHCVSVSLWLHQTSDLTLSKKLNTHLTFFFLMRAEQEEELLGFRKQVFWVKGQPYFDPGLCLSATMFVLSELIVYFPLFCCLYGTVLVLLSTCTRLTRTLWDLCSWPNGTWPDLSHWKCQGSQVAFQHMECGVGGHWSDLFVSVYSHGFIVTTQRRGGLELKVGLACAGVMTGQRSAKLTMASDST